MLGGVAASTSARPRIQNQRHRTHQGKVFACRKLGKTQKASASTLAFRWCGETEIRTRGQNNRSQLTGCCITTLPPLQKIPLGCNRSWLRREGKNSESFTNRATCSGSSYLGFHRGSPQTLKLNNLMKKLLFLGAFAFFALTVSARPRKLLLTTRPRRSKLARRMLKGVLQQRQSSRMLQQVRCFSRRQRATCSRTSLLDAAASRVLLPTPRARRAAGQSRLLLKGHGRSQPGTKESPRRSAATRPLACPRASDSCNTELERAAHGVALFLSRSVCRRPQGPNFPPLRAGSVLCHGVGPIAQQDRHLPSKQTVRGSSPCGIAFECLKRCQTHRFGRTWYLGRHESSHCLLFARVEHGFCWVGTRGRIATLRVHHDAGWSGSLRHVGQRRWHPGHFGYSRIGQVMLYKSSMVRIEDAEPGTRSPGGSGHHVPRPNH